jgi:hypothetical protein
MGRLQRANYQKFKERAKKYADPEFPSELARFGEVRDGILKLNSLFEEATIEINASILNTGAEGESALILAEAQTEGEWIEVHKIEITTIPGEEPFTYDGTLRIFVGPLLQSNAF